MADRLDLACGPVRAGRTEAQYAAHVAELRDLWAEHREALIAEAPATTWWAIDAFREAA
jgi:hypothetical protein